MIDINNMSDQEVVNAIINKDVEITKRYLYEKCYPLFNAIYNKYYTDCENVVELINEIYVYILLPNKITGQSKLKKFEYRCTLTMWLKIVTENFCHQLYSKNSEFIESNISLSDRNLYELSSLSVDSKETNLVDVQNLLNIMPNQRYRRLIELRYIEERTNEETAQLLGMTMDNYYNKHKLAKAQYNEILR